MRSTANIPRQLAFPRCKGRSCAVDRQRRAAASLAYHAAACLLHNLDSDHSDCDQTKVNSRFVRRCPALVRPLRPCANSCSRVSRVILLRRPEDAMGLTQAQRAMIEKARTGGGSGQAIALTDAACAQLGRSYRQRPSASKPFSRIAGRGSRTLRVPRSSVAYRDRHPVSAVNRPARLPEFRRGHIFRLPCKSPAG